MSLNPNDVKLNFDVDQKNLFRYISDDQSFINRVKIYLRTLFD